MDNVLTGKVWIITDKNKNLIDDIDTDMIFHNAHLAITDIKEMGKYAFGNLEGWEDFPQKTEKNDIIIVGKNFGAGSSRQQAVDCFRSLGCSLIIAESFGAIYKRNAINAGFPILTMDSLPEKISLEIENREELKVNLETGVLFNISKNNPVGKTDPFSKVQMDIYKAGSLFAYAKGL
ncbi:3-isopropylmalate dehydratase [candidate division KSB1 bacterium]